MQCEKCKKNTATVFLTQIVGGKMHKVDLCEHCAKDTGVSDSAGFSLADLLLNMNAESIHTQRVQERYTCPACEYTYEDLKKTGRLGCPECYTVFSDALKNILKDMHKSLQHRGKVPARTSIHVECQNEKIVELQKNLSEAVRSENYEQAAQLRDQIRLLQEATQD